MVYLVNSHSNATRIGQHLWEIDLRFDPGLPPGWRHPAAVRAPIPRRRRGALPRRWRGKVLPRRRRGGGGVPTAKGAHAKGDDRRGGGFLCACMAPDGEGCTRASDHAPPGTDNP